MSFVECCLLKIRLLIMRFIYLLFTIVVCGSILFADFVYTCAKKLMNMLICPLKLILRRFKGSSR